jgi:peptidoglycan/LPS O-acetylase OafA/YrhL
MENFSGRIPSLDGLRTISIVLVIVGHLFHVFGIGGFGNLGNLGVRIFFIISGFLITGLLLKEIAKTEKIDLLKFYFRRTLRIFPPYYFYLLVVLAASLLGFIAVPLISFISSATYTSNYFNPANWYLGHTWSLSVEEQFYLILPGILLLLGIRKTRFFLCFIFLVSPFIRVFLYKMFGDETIWMPKGFQSNMDALAIGCLLSLFYTEFHQNRFYRKFLNSKLVFVFPVIIVALNLLTDRPLIFYGFSISIINLLIAMTLDWAVTNYDSFAGKILNSSLMVTLGMMSYSIYLWQQPFFNSENPSILTKTPFNFIGLIAMTLISYYLVEKYSIKLRQRLETKFFKREKEPVSNPTNYQISTT